MTGAAAAGVTAVILCGGGGTRLGGIDKPLRSFCGEPLVARALRTLAPQTAALLISANRNLDRYRAYAPVCTDAAAFAGGGPLAGILAGLDAAQTEDVLFAPGDAPLLPRNLLRHLAEARARSKGAQLSYALDGAGPQPLCCLLPRALREDLRAYLDAGGRAPREWYRRHAAAAADFSAHPAWGWSLNTEEEWVAAERKFEQHKAP